MPAAVQDVDEIAIHIRPPGGVLEVFRHAIAVVVMGERVAHVPLDLVVVKAACGLRAMAEGKGEFAIPFRPEELRHHFEAANSPCG